MININSDITSISPHHDTSYADEIMLLAELSFVFDLLTKLAITFWACPSRDLLDRSIKAIFFQVRAIGRNAAS